MIGGNIPGVTRTVSIDIYDQVQAANYAAANAMALLLLGFCFAVLVLVYGFNRSQLANNSGAKLWSMNPIK
jgi:molybdate transport system permease protein